MIPDTSGIVSMDVWVSIGTTPVQAEGVRSGSNSGVVLWENEIC